MLNHPVSFTVNDNLTAAIYIGMLLFAILASAWACFYVARFILVRLVAKVIGRGRAPWLALCHQYKVFHRLSLIFPIFFLYLATPLLSGISFKWIAWMGKPLEIITSCSMVFLSLLSLMGFLSASESYYNQFPLAKNRPIKSYLQVLKILFSTLAVLFIISILLDKSVGYFVTGLSAMTAVLLLIFRDSILGFVTSVQLSTNDIVRIGDWIELPQHNADGHIIDIALNTIKVKNFDHSIVFIPTHAFLANSVKNLRNIDESGARRIKRAIYLDVTSIHRMTSEKISFFVENQLISEKQFTELDLENTSNLTLLRLHIQHYLSKHHSVQQDMPTLVRLLEPSSNGKGLPLEFYFFSKETAFNQYEQVQSSVMEYIYGALDAFSLRPI